MICEAKERYPEISVSGSLSRWIDTRLTFCALQMALDNYGLCPEKEVHTKLSVAFR